MTQVTSTALAIAMLVAGYFSARSVTPPNLSSPEERHQTDRISFIAGPFATAVRCMIMVAVTYHALLTVIPDYAPDYTSQICPHPENLNHSLFTWNQRTVLTLFFIYIGSFIRLSAYGGLGRHFTFHLVRPGQLVTSGIYRWMQHPSYTGLALISVSCTHLFMQFNGAPACWISESTLAHMLAWGPYVVFGVSVFGLWVLVTRVRDEEAMLRQQFGDEWEQWHRKTKRFIPCVI